MAAPSYRRAHGLTPKQLNAVDLIVAGLTDSAVAEQIGVNRNTVNRWRLYDPTFQVALGERRAQLLSSAADALRSALPLALDTLREQLRIGVRRDRLALDLLSRIGLQGIGGTKPSSEVFAIGPTTIESILDVEVRRARAAVGAHDADGEPEPPISDQERDDAYTRLLALANEPESESPHEAAPPSQPDPLAESHPPSSPSASFVSGSMGAFA